MTRVGFSGKGGVSEAEVATLIAAHAGLESEHHTKFTTTEHDVVARHPLANLNAAVCSETEADAKVAAVVLIPAKASADLRNSNDGTKNTTLNSWTKIKEVLLNADLAGCRLKFTMRTSPTVGTARARVYKNGVGIGIDQEEDAGSWTEHSEDFSGWVSGDLIQIYARHTNAGNSSEVRYMRFYYHWSITGLGEKTLDAEIAITDDPTISMTNQDP